MRRFDKSLGAVVLLTGCIAAAISTAARGADEPLRIDTGLIAGKRVGDDGKIRAFKGIPFAAPPVGKLRWQPPQPAATWQGVRERCDSSVRSARSCLIRPARSMSRRRNRRARIACL